MEPGLESESESELKSRLKSELWSGLSLCRLDVVIIVVGVGTQSTHYAVRCEHAFCVVNYIASHPHSRSTGQPSSWHANVIHVSELRFYFYAIHLSESMCGCL